jgi:hypothetical protein
MRNATGPDLDRESLGQEGIHTKPDTMGATKKEPHRGSRREACSSLSWDRGICRVRVRSSRRRAQPGERSGGAAGADAQPGETAPPTAPNELVPNASRTRRSTPYGPVERPRLPGR